MDTVEVKTDGFFSYCLTRPRGSKTDLPDKQDESETTSDSDGQERTTDHSNGETDGVDVQKRKYNEEGAAGDAKKQEWTIDDSKKQDGVSGNAEKQEGPTGDAGSKETPSQSRVRPRDFPMTRDFPLIYEDGKSHDDKSQEKTFYHMLRRIAKKWMKSLHFNLQGLKKFLEEDYTEALDWFQQAAATDDTNTNALRHCRVIYSQLNMFHKVEEMSQQIEALSTGEHAQASRARSVAEVAIACMLHPMLNCYKPSCYQMLKHAIESARSGVGEMEKAFWKLSLIQACEENLSLEESIDRHRYVWYAELACGDFAEMTAIALAQLGAVLQRPGSMELKDMLEGIIQEQHILGGSLEPEDYLRAAYALDPTSPSVCLSYTMYLTRSNQLSKAKDMMKKTFSLTKDEIYVSARAVLSARAVRGELLVKLYREEEQRKEYLIQAVDDLRYSVRHTMSPRSMGQLGTTLQYLLVHDNQISIDTDDMERCLAYFQKAIDLVDGVRYTQTHLHHSKCLAEFGYIRKAVESSKRVIENDDLHKGSTFFMYHLMKQFEKLYEVEGRPDFILSEMTFWMLLMCDKYAHLEEDMQRTFGNLWRNKSVMVRMYHNLLHLGYYNIADLFPRYIQNFSLRCRDRPIEFLAPPSIAFPHNQHNKVYDVLVLHSVTDRPWVYYSLLTKLEMIHELKCCLVGRDILHQDIRDDVYEDEFAANAFHSPGSNLLDDLRVTPKAKIGGNKTDPDPSLMSAVQNSVCIILVISKNTLNSIWFQDGKPSSFLCQLVDSDQKVIALCMQDDLLDCDELFPGIKAFDCSELVPWEGLVYHIKICSGDSEQELRTFDVDADLKKDTMIGEDEDGHFDGLDMMDD